MMLILRWPRLPVNLLAAVLFFTGGTAFGAGLKALRGHVPEITQKLTAVGRLSATNELHLAIGLPLRDPAGLDQFLTEVYDPASPNYRHFLTPEEFTARFSATEADYAAVKNFALTNGFKITGEHGNRMLLDVYARAGDIERAFHIKLNKFNRPTEAGEFFAPDAEPTVAVNLPVADVQGLDDFYRPHPKLRKQDPKIIAPKAGGSGPSSSFIGDDFRNAYAPGVQLTGEGQSVGLLQFDGFYPSDIAAYASAAGGGRTNIQVQPILIGVTNLSIGVNGGNTEVSLDIEMAMSMAPGLSKIYVFETSSTSYLNTMLNAMAASNTVKNLSSSWGWGGGPNTTRDNIFQQMAAQGQSYFNASGDSDAFTVGANSSNGVDNTSKANAPSSSPYVIQVGGTTLTMTGSGASYSSETVWNWNNSGQPGVGSSGGVSSYYSIPSWQTNISMATNLGSSSQRNIPDVALTAANVYVISGGSGAGTSGNGGTSCAAPLWAGFMALVNQQAAMLGNPSAGFINPAISTIGTGQNPNYTYAECFHDTTTGNNFWSSSPANYPAVAGYDLCTGWGTPNGQNLINALAGPPDPLGITPYSGFTAVGAPGGPFSPSSQIFTLTNSGASSFSWSIINTSAWINVSSSSGTLASGATTSVTVSLASAANSLSLGTYTAGVVFSNQASHITQTRPCSLQVVEPLVLLTANGFTANGPAGGPFYPGTQTVLFTNLSPAAISWSLVNTSSWLTVSSSSGTLSGNSSTSVTVSTNTATAGLVNGSYTSSLVLSNRSSHVTQSLGFTALVGQNMIPNGGFETGDDTSWTLSDSSGPDMVDNGASSAITPHTGSYEFVFGQANSLAYLSQNLATSPGQTYLLSLWVSNPNSGNGTQTFEANWNGSTLFTTNGSNASFKFSWTNLRFIVVATSTNTSLQFAAQNRPDYFALDDVTVTPITLPAITQQPTNLTVVAGNNAVFSAAATGTAPLAFQWRANGTNLTNGSGISGATGNVLTLSAVTTNRAGNYSLVVTNLYGSTTSSVAALTVILSPFITTNVATQTIECGGNASWSVGASGTAPLAYQWKWDGTNIAGATGTSLSLTNIHLPSHTIAVVVTNLYGSVTNSAPLNVQDTTPPVITLAGANPYYVELGGTFTDPGATASDACAGALAVTRTGTVKTTSVGTNFLTYSATDGSFSVTNSRTVIVRDTTPPVILWSFTNLVLAAGTNLSVQMPDVTSTNFILATDLSGTVSVTQNPTNNFPLPLGTNTVVLTVADLSSNIAYSTNTIVVVFSTNPIPKVSNPVFQGSGVALQLSGGYGSTYVLECTTDFVFGVWLPLATNTIGVSGVWQFTDSSVTNIPMRCYRLRLVQ